MSDHEASTAFKVLEHADPPVGEEEAAQLLKLAFDLEGAAKRLHGERDQNFQITCKDGRRFILKISNSAEDPAVTDLQTRALLHVAATAPGIPIPRLQRSVEGDPQFRWKQGNRSSRVVRLLSFLPGVLLRSVKPSRALLWAIGAELARLDQALADFRHPAENHKILWDLQHAHLLHGVIGAVSNSEHRRLALEGLAIFERFAVPRFPQLRAQTIQNDANPSNVFIDPAGRAVTGILDFGDAVRAPLIIDLAVAAAYHVEPNGGDPFTSVSVLASGYHHHVSLEGTECEILCPLMAGRLAISVIITSWRCRLHPENSDYILRNLSKAISGLECLLGQDPAAARTWRLTDIAAEIAKDLASE
jgi:Ser/Thr protein kinase RdoA (MazF antagonist)